MVGPGEEGAPVGKGGPGAGAGAGRGLLPPPPPKESSFLLPAPTEYLEKMSLAICKGNSVFFFHVLRTFRQLKTWESRQPTFASSPPPAAADDGLGGRRKLPDLEKSRKKEEAELLRLGKKKIKTILQQETKFHLFLFSPVLPHLLLPPAPCHQPGPFHLLVLVLVVVVLFLLFLARGGLGGREVL